DYYCQVWDITGKHHIF
nr:immunoglobulin light chain junction region [Macaca mulatta]MOX17369.1 immunoglobulin light chain junction region [Macaca mulatta]MOX17626.1 immunoglobulin light chain junction region [Macaca mulatta]MOX17931.1 immunoglobulin light chain junction region [Macaca mulatta]MOX18411.1 immunoglobulin light chain junction region [Macaca mulatta]